MEERGESDYKYYTELLAKDLVALGDNTGKYEQKFCDKVMAIYNHKSKCASAMIVGPAKFKPNERALSSERKAIEHFTYWRERYFRLVNRVRRKTPRDLIYDHAQEIIRLEEVKARRKEKGEYYQSITNRIRYHRERIENLEARITLSDKFQERVIPDGKIYYSNDRIIVEHGSKPTREVIDQIKKHGFRFSPKTKTWVRQFTANAIYEADKLAAQLLRMAL